MITIMRSVNGNPIPDKEARNVLFYRRWFSVERHTRHNKRSTLDRLDKYNSCDHCSG